MIWKYRNIKTTLKCPISYGSSSLITMDVGHAFKLDTLISKKKAFYLAFIGIFKAVEIVSKK